MIENIKVWNNTNNLSINDFKTEIQTHQINTLIDKMSVLDNCYTGWGKTYSTIKAIEMLLVLSSDNLRVMIVVPSIKLKDDFEKKLSLIKNKNFIFEVIVINSLTIYDKGNKEVDLLIIDEIHNVLGADAKCFNTAIDRINFKRFKGMSASLTREQINLLDSKLVVKGFDKTYRYELTLFWAYKNKLIPQFNIYNVPIELTLREKSEYNEHQQTFRKYSSWFSQYNIYSPFDNINYKTIANAAQMQEGSIVGMHNKWRNSVTQRKVIIQNAENKLKVLRELLPLFEEKVMVFVTKNDFADEIENTVEGAKAYHTSLKKIEGMTMKKQLEIVDINFRNNTNPYIVSVGKLKEAYDVPDCAVNLRVGYTASVKDTIQIGGKFLPIPI